MRIGYLVNIYPKVSHTFIRREIAELERQGFHVRRYAMRGWDAAAPDPVDQLERERTRYILLEPKWRLLKAVASCLKTNPTEFARSLAFELRRMRKTNRPVVYHLAYLVEACAVAQWAREERLDHLHAHFGTNSAEIAMLAAALAGVGYSFTMHGSDEWDRPEYLALGEKVARAAFVAAISSYTRSQLFRWSAPTDWPKIKVVRCGLDREFLASDLPTSELGRRLLFVGRIYEGKGTTILLEAAAKLAREGLDFELVFAGDGEGRAQVEATAARLGIEGHVSVTGWIGSQQVQELLESSRSLVLPSFAEGIPVVIMEALACGRPVISTYVGGIPELVEPGRNGWLVPAGDVEGLATAMRDCLERPDEDLRAMGRAGRQRVEELHDVRIETSALAELFKSARRPEVSSGAHIGMPAGRSDPEEAGSRSREAIVG